MEPKRFLTYRDVSDVLAAIRTELVPVEAYKSHLLPTLRWKEPAWIGFAAPQILQPACVQVGRPDRWWSISARSKRLLAYAEEAVVPLLTPVLHAESERLIPLSGPGATIGEIRRRQEVLAEGLDLVSCSFLGVQVEAKEVRDKVLSAIADSISPEIMLYYRAAAVDFFEWLEM